MLELHKSIKFTLYSLWAFQRLKPQWLRKSVSLSIVKIQIKAQSNINKLIKNECTPEIDEKEIQTFDQISKQVYLIRLKKEAEENKN